MGTVTIFYNEPVTVPDMDAYDSLVEQNTQNTTLNNTKITVYPYRIAGLLIIILGMTGIIISTMLPNRQKINKLNRK